MFLWSVNIALSLMQGVLTYMCLSSLHIVSISVYLLSGLAIIWSGVLSAFNAPKLH